MYKRQRSDRLITQEAKVSASYLRLLERSSEYNKRRIVREYKEFKKARVVECKKVRCLILKNAEMFTYLNV